MKIREVVIADTYTDPINRTFKHGGKKLSLRVERSNLALAMGLPLPKAFGIAMTVNNDDRDDD
jgi:hypothetical protein